MIEILLMLLVGSILFKYSLLISYRSDMGFKKAFIDLGFYTKFPKYYLFPIIGSLIALIGSIKHKKIKHLVALISELLITTCILTLYHQYGLTYDLLFKSLWILVFFSLALIDLNNRRLPNYLLFPLIYILLFIMPFWNIIGYERGIFDLNGYMGSIINTGFTSICLVLFWAGIYYGYPGSIGGGDIKLIAVIGLLFGFPDAVIVVYLAIMAGGGFSAIKMILSKNIRSVSIPFGTVLSFASVFVIIYHNELSQGYDFIAQRLI